MEKYTYGHSKRSVRQVGYSGFVLTDDERDAILWHMGGKRCEYDEAKRVEFYKIHLLVAIIHDADRYSIRDRYEKKKAFNK